MISVNSILPNGATVLALRAKANATIVLADWPRNGDREFITWVSDEKGATYHGHYFRSYEKALSDFATR